MILWIVWDEMKPVKIGHIRTDAKFALQGVLDTEDSSVRRSQNLVVCSLNRN
jgi:hypothetical protein